MRYLRRNIVLIWWKSVELIKNGWSMKSWLKTLKWFILVTGILFAVIFLCIVFNKTFYTFDTSLSINADLASKFGEFVGGFIGTLFAFLSILIVAYSILKQTCENRKNNVKEMFFQMIDYHYKNLEQIEVPKPNRRNVIEKGKRGFVVFKIQINRLLQALYQINEENDLQLKAHDIACIAYMVFYYGLSDSWRSFLEEKIQCYDCRSIIINRLLKINKLNPEMRLCQANHTVLSAYFRNMYNAIKLIDSEKEFSDNEKVELVKIYRAQLSNPELYILFFNVISPFGKKWRKMDFIKRYKLLKNIPKGYLDGYNPKLYFDIEFEHEEINCATDTDEFPIEEPHLVPSQVRFKTNRVSSLFNLSVLSWLNRLLCKNN